jgi:hypothetical protein
VKNPDTNPVEVVVLENGQHILGHAILFVDDAVLLIPREGGYVRPPYELSTDAILRRNA